MEARTGTLIEVENLEDDYYAAKIKLRISRSLDKELTRKIFDSLVSDTCDIEIEI